MALAQIVGFILPMLAVFLTFQSLLKLGNYSSESLDRW